MEQGVKTCELCGRSDVEITGHHLYPRTTHRTKWFRNHCKIEDKDKKIYLCKICHKGVHDLFNEKQLCREYNTLDLLKNNENVRRHVEWAKKQK